MVIGGVIYLHDISSDRFSGTARRNLDIFHKLCGDEAFEKVDFVTSKWGLANGRDFGKRQEELKDKYWKSMLDRGAGVKSLVHGDEGASVWAVVSAMLDRVNSEPLEAKSSKFNGLEIQRELIKLHKATCDTKAGLEVQDQLQKVLDEQKQLRALEDDAASGDPQAKAQLRAQEEKIAQQLKDMKVSLPRRLSGWMKSVMGV